MPVTTISWHPAALRSPSLAPAICTSSAGFDRAAFHVGFDSEVVKFFAKTLGS